MKSGRKRKFFEEIAGCGYTVFCFESPFRIAATLQLIAQVMPDAAIAVIREATKIHEEVLRGRAAELAAEAGCAPEIFASANTENGDEKNEAFIRKYKPLVKAM